MKSSLLKSYFFLVIIGSLINHALYSMNQSPQQPLSDQEIEALFNEFWQGIDQETLNELAKIGEEIIKEAESKGIDPIDLIMQESGMPPEQKPPTPVAAPAVPKGPTIVNISKVNQARDFLKDLTKTIPSIRQKITNESSLRMMLDPYKYDLDDIVYYAYTLQDEKLINYLADKEFDTLFEQLKTLSSKLKEYDQKLVIPEFVLEGINSYEVLNIDRNANQDEIVAAYQQLSATKDPEQLQSIWIAEGKTGQALEDDLAQAQEEFNKINLAYNILRSEQESKFIVQEIADVLYDALKNNKIIDSIKVLLAKYEPEVLKLKQEREKTEEEARQAQKRAQDIAASMPRLYFEMPYSAGFENFFTGTPYKYPTTSYTPPPFTSFGGESGGGPTTLGGAGALTPSKSGTEGAKTGGKSGKKEGEKGEKKEKKEGKEKRNKGESKKPTTPSASIDTDILRKTINLSNNIDTNVLPKIEAALPFLEQMEKTQHLNTKFEESQIPDIENYKKNIMDVAGALLQVNIIDKELKDLKKKKNITKENEYKKEVTKIVENLEKKDAFKKLGATLRNIAKQIQAINPHKNYIYRGEVSALLPADKRNEDLMKMNKLTDENDPSKGYQDPLKVLLQQYTKFKEIENKLGIKKKKKPEPAQPPAKTDQ